MPHTVRAARIAYVHTWLSTQTEGWWRLALDSIQVPYDYMSTQAIAKIREQVPSTPELLELLTFIETSERGFIK